MKIRTAVFVLLAAAPCAFAQPPAAPPGAPPARMAPIVSPEIATDGRVTFRLRAPNAREVYVSGIGQPAAPAAAPATPAAAPAPGGRGGGPRLDMQKNEQGVWSVTTPEPMPPGIYQYTLNVDGLRIADPGNNKFQTGFNSASSSRLVVPGGLWTPAPGIARGAVTRHFVHSAIAGDDRDFWVYTPPGYDPTRTEPYPVFFLLHGLGDEANSWMENGAAHVILDNLIAQGKAKPMLMVNTLGYGYPNGPAGAMREGMLENFSKIVLQEVLPIVEQRYHVGKTPAMRAIAGLSMGGAEATFIGLNNLETFGYVGSFSGAYVMWPGAVPPGGSGPAGPRRISTEAVAKVFPALDAKANTGLKLLWMTCGTADSLVGVNRTFHEWLDVKGVKHTYIEVPDIGHVWPFWRQNLADFAALLFQSPATTGAWQIVWQDEFDSTLHPDWVFDIGRGTNGWGNNELQFYTRRPENVRIENGTLVIEARKEAYESAEYTSARLKTEGRRSFRYGRFEARIQVPRGQGLWPAFWALGDDRAVVRWPACGEIDVMENVGREPATVHGTVHGPDYWGGKGVGAAFTLPEGAFADAFHIFAVEWEPARLTFTVDGKPYKTITPADLTGRWVFDHPFFLLVNLAVGGNWPGPPDGTTVFPAQLRIDYVRVYERVGATR